MPAYDDSWRDGYDAWKLASPDDDYPYEECQHDDFDIDVLEGRCRCTCGDSWWASEAQIKAAIDAAIANDEYEARENRRQWWRELTYPIRWRIYRMLEPISPRRSTRVLHEDEIPF